MSDAIDRDPLNALGYRRRAWMHYGIPQKKSRYCMPMTEPRVRIAAKENNTSMLARGVASKL
jgi:hypothetical protein